MLKFRHLRTGQCFIWYGERGDDDPVVHIRTKAGHVALSGQHAGVFWYAECGDPMLDDRVLVCDVEGGIIPTLTYSDLKPGQWFRWCAATGPGGLKTAGKQYVHRTEFYVTAPANSALYDPVELVDPPPFHSNQDG